MKKIVNLSFALLALSIATGCSGDSEIAPYKPVFFSESFESRPSGSGSNEVPIAIEGWTNYNALGLRNWSCKVFDNNNFAEFSSFYSTNASTSDDNDEVWLITSKIDFTATTNETLLFKTESRFSNGAQLKVLISTDFNGTTAGIATATWTELNPTLPTVDNVFVDSGYIDLSAPAFESSNVYIAFKYIGSKPGSKTTTFQLDGIKLFENK
ncbi:choice-of-anchor J domain-containing protein [Flavobacterium phycosphaerae]|uniref:choice-of-anchor J domain-containing protein n=1 Tax=Flavobacterium phycosphaerae TaxID=2697515 RepID=UPI001389551C|nr:choice-of-anchor J domain-containing protein [Flavobacterium phycosphaerae]